MLYLALCPYAAIQANDILEFEFNVSNLGSVQSSPSISINGSGVVAYALANMTTFSNLTAFGVPDGSSALYLIEPYFVVKKIKQDTVSYLQPNNITIVLQVNCDVPQQSFITITGLYQTNTPTNPSLSIIAPVSVFASTADWDASGILIISVVQDGMTIGTNFSIIVPLVNPLLGQDSPVINISCVIDTTFANAPIPPSNMEKDLGNLAPLLVNNFVYAYIQQSTPSSGAVNTLTVSIQARASLTVSENTKITISGLVGSDTPSTSNLKLVDTQNSDSTLIFGDSCEWINNVSTQMLILTVIADSQAGTMYSFSFNLTNGVTGQNEPAIQVWASGDSSPGTTMSIPTSKNLRPMRIGKFNVKTLTQNTPVSGALNTIYFIFSVNVDLSTGDAVMTVGNLSGAIATSPISLNYGLIGARADTRFWDGSQYRRGLWTTNTLTLLQYGTFWADTTYSLQFSVTNPTYAQEPPDVTVSVSGPIAIATVLALKTGLTIKGVVRGSDTLRVLVPEFVTAIIAQSTCLSGASNYLYVTLQTNINLENVDGASITIKPLTGAKAASPVTLLPVTNGNSAELLFQDASGNVGYGLWGCTSCAFETLYLTIGSGLIMQTGVQYAFKAEIRNPRPDEWTLPQEYAVEAPVSITANGAFASFASKTMQVVQESRDGITNGSLPLKVVVPSFVTKIVGQASASQNSSNSLTFTLQISVDVTRNSSILISNMNGLLIETDLVQLSSPTNLSSDFVGAEIFSGSRNLEVAETGGWEAASSSLSLFFVNGSLANQTIVFSVHGRNQEQGQQPQVLSILLTIEHGTYDSAIGPEAMLSSTGDAAPLLIAQFLSASSWQSNASAAAANTISVSFSTSASLLQGGVLLVSGLNGTDPDKTVVSTIEGNASAFLSLHAFDWSRSTLILNVTNNSMAGDVYVFSFSVNNSLQGQAPPSLFVSTTGTLNILPHAVTQAAGNAATLLIARWLRAEISQNNSLAGEENLLTIEFEVNVNLNSDSVISISGLGNLGLSLYFPLLQDSSSSVGSQLLTGDKYANTAGTGSYVGGNVVFYVRRGLVLEARTVYSLSFKVVNPSVVQQAQHVSIQVTGTLSIPQQAMNVLSAMDNQPGVVNKVSTPRFSSPVAVTCISRCLIFIRSSTQGAAIFYTLDESLPSNASSLYSGPFYVSSTTRVCAVAVKEGLEDSDVANSSTFYVQASSPVFVSQASSNRSDAFQLSIFCSTSQSSIYYRLLYPQTSPATFDSSFLSYSSPILAPSDATIESFCNKTGLLASSSSYWPLVQYDFAQASQQLGTYVDAICASKSLVHADDQLDFATAGQTLRFFIVANDELGKVVNLVFNDSLPWNITMYPKTSYLIPTVQGRVSYPLKGLVRPFETIGEGGASSPTAGYFVGTISPVLSGDHKVFVQLGMQDVLGSPFLVSVLPAPAVCGSRSTLVGYGLTFAALIPYRNTFFIEARDEFGNMRPGQLPDDRLFASFLVRTQFAYQQSPDCNQSACRGCSALETSGCSSYAPPFLGFSAGGLTPPWRGAISTIAVKILPQLQEPSSSLSSCLTSDQSERQVLSELGKGSIPASIISTETPRPVRTFTSCTPDCFTWGWCTPPTTSGTAQPDALLPNDLKTVGKFGLSDFADSTLETIGNLTWANESFVIRLHGMMTMKRKTSQAKSFRWSNISTSDRVKVWVDNSLIIDQWTSLSSVQPSAYYKFFDLSFPYDVFIEWKIPHPTPNTSAELQLSDAVEELRHCQSCQGSHRVLRQVCMGGSVNLTGSCVNHTACNCSDTGELYCDGISTAQEATCSCLGPNSGSSCAADADCTGGGSCTPLYESFPSYRIFSPYELVGSPYRLNFSPAISSASFCCENILNNNITCPTL
ncbi:hypothetical protein GUITHDRAFT_135976 [Guillardia theta CCMP2712]|uniref:GH29D-like beta-sandwich domain-containing protein n=1 Tax=Guillardia theta (strain CCMP2712) TaxID=905079 RepID=L1JMJ9_GUITC|nr:hypothetical protein GUITHDRAFT_135976 [Guillardia theta CCMP2712]EKX49278.1 hypothetical protein GUITHDRAFT_135976 [Guillardia theta CCMP2712]|eukprot:XP_005836258.1 hypothetical protein GUITHDRAFT_135976 [Guillardia theta CCMP2712]